jgi:hypothetical protein
MFLKQLWSAVMLGNFKLFDVLQLVCCSIAPELHAVLDSCVADPDDFCPDPDR